MKHTKGNWNWHRQGLSANSFSLETKKVYIGNITINHSLVEKDEDEAIANLNLIASAPELLEALKSLYNSLGNWHEDFDSPMTEKLISAHDMAEQAIKKAEG